MGEGSQENREQIKKPLEVFREEVRAWIKNELAKKERGEEYDPHAELPIDPKDLTDSEREIWEKVINQQTLTREDLKEYEKRLGSRRNLMEMLINKAAFLTRREWEEKLSREQRREK